MSHAHCTHIGFLAIASSAVILRRTNNGGEGWVGAHDNLFRLRFESIAQPIASGSNLRRTCSMGKAVLDGRRRRRVGALGCREPFWPTSRKCLLEPLEKRFLLTAGPTVGVAPWFAELHADQGASESVDRWIVRLSNDALVGVDSVAAAAALLGEPEFGLDVIRGLGLPGQLLVETPSDAGAAASAWFQSDAAIAYFQPDSILRGQLAPTIPTIRGRSGCTTRARPVAPPAPTSMPKPPGTSPRVQPTWSWR